MRAEKYKSENFFLILTTEFRNYCLIHYFVSFLFCRKFLFCKKFAFWWRTEKKDFSHKNSSKINALKKYYFIYQTISYDMGTELRRSLLRCHPCNPGQSVQVHHCTSRRKPPRLPVIASIWHLREIN